MVLTMNKVATIKGLDNCPRFARCAYGESMKGIRGFPGDWPPGCPPADAVAAHAVVYRTVQADPPTTDDFVTYRELGKRVSPGQECKAASLSVFLNEKDALHHREAFRWKGNARLIAKGQLTADCGVTRPTPSNRYPSHLSWWPYEGVDRSAVFTVVVGL
jgi:hypothetical protein